MGAGGLFVAADIALWVPVTCSLAYLSRLLD